MVIGMRRSIAACRLLVCSACVAAVSAAAGQVSLPDAKPVPRVEIIPLPYDQASIRRDGVELTRYYFDSTLRRPFLFPVVGPSGRSLTRMGHPHDPVSHSHHNSVWVSHDNVGGESFWTDRADARIVHQRIVRYEDGDERARIVAVNAWKGADGTVRMLERRGVTVRPLDGGEWLMLLDLQFEAPKEPVTLDLTPFGMVGVRMAKTIGVLDGGGLIRNSEGNTGEEGPDGAFRKQARWADYSGPIAPGVNEGITLMDHPANPNHPAHFHVRGDGWMGACLTLEKPITIAPGDLLRLRYGLYVHAGVPEAKDIDARWKAFAETTLEDLPVK
jgi:hypothetical protein